MHAPRLAKLLTAATFAVTALATTPLAHAGIGIPQKHPDGIGIPQKHRAGVGIPQKHPDAGIRFIIAI